MKKKTLASAAAVSLLLLGVPAVSHASSTFDSTARRVDQTLPLTFAAASNLDIQCFQNGTSVAMDVAAGSTGDGYADLKVAFTNPSVQWKIKDELYNGSLAGWYKKSGKDGSWQAAPASDTTTISLHATVGSNGKEKGTRTVTGNPYVYYVQTVPETDPMTEEVLAVDPAIAPAVAENTLGHCNNGLGNNTLRLSNWKLTGTFANQGHVKQGSCVTSSKSSSAVLHQHNNSITNVTAADQVTVIYSNKKVEVNDGVVTMTSGDGSQEHAYPMRGAPDNLLGFDWKGFHVWWEQVNVTATVAPFSIDKDYDKSLVKGIGGNPNVFIGGGVDDSKAEIDLEKGITTLADARKNSQENPFYPLGRCNTL